MLDNIGTAIRGYISLSQMWYTNLPYKGIFMSNT